MPKLFLSHTRRDSIVAEKIAAALGRAGVETIEPVRHPARGTTWRQSIKDALAEADAVVLVIASPDAVSGSWIAYEAGVAEALGKPIIVVVSHDIPRDEVPVELANQEIVLFDPAQPAKVVPTVQHRLRALA